MKTGKITAKLRDAVPVYLMVDGRITFQIHYENGVLPATFPAPRAKMTRAEKAAAKAAREAKAEEATEETAPACREIAANWKLSQSNNVAVFGFSYESKHIRICSFVHFSTARSRGRSFLSKKPISVVSMFFSNFPPSYRHSTKIFTIP